MVIAANMCAHMRPEEASVFDAHDFEMKLRTKYAIHYLYSQTSRISCILCANMSTHTHETSVCLSKKIFGKCQSPESIETATAVRKLLAAYPSRMLICADGTKALH